MERDLSYRNVAARLSEPIRRYFLRQSYKRADRIIAVAEDVAAPIRTFVPHPDRVTVIPNPVIDDNFRDALSAPLRHPWASQDRRYRLLLAIGRLEMQKGFDILLSAFALLIRRLPARLVILGDGKRRSALEEQRAALGLDDLVELRGYEAAVAPWLARADLQVSSSRFEGASAALVEGLAAGCPMVVSDCPGNSRSLVEESSAGLVVPVGDPVALADAMERALRVRWDRQAICAHAAPFHVNSAVDEYHSSLCALLSRRSDKPMS
jgi:glycosyltransferase involved in cell wall biosynthesis